MKKLLLLVTFVMALNLVSATGPFSCYTTMSSVCTEFAGVDGVDGYVVSGHITAQGHFGVRGYDAGYTLCCPHVMVFDDTEDYDFWLLGSGGQGHVSLIDEGFGTGYDFGTNLGVCSVRSDGCEVGELRLFDVSDDVNSHTVFDGSNPVANDFGLSVCCELVEVCNNNLDDNLDGFIDCASPSCHPSAQNSFVPQECTGNNQTTAYCLANPGACDGPGGLPYYCSYGISDNPAVEPQGYCCEAGFYAIVDSGTGEVSCTETTECGIDPPLACNFDFETQTGSWFASVYSGDPSNWCVSRYDEFFNPLFSPDDRSSGACCNVGIYGHEAYYVAEGNVRVWG